MPKGTSVPTWSQPGWSSDESSGSPLRVSLAPITVPCTLPVPRGRCSLHTDAPHRTHSVTNNHALETEMLLGGSGAAWFAPARLQPHGTRGSVHRTQTVLWGESSRKCRRRWRR